MTDIWRDRIIEVQKMRAGDILPHVGNWREHPQAQAAAMKGVLGEVGKIDALHAWYSERNGGKLTYFNGHLRRDLRPDETWTILITDLSDDEADYALATLDRTTGMAEIDIAALDALLTVVRSDDEAVQKMLAELAEEAGIRNEPQGEDPGPQVDKADELRQKWGVEPGQLWLLDSGKGHPHRLICGDCTDKAVVERVMGGEKAGMILTDPPYAIYGSSTGIGGDVTDGNMVRPFMRAALSMYVTATDLGAHIYTFCDWRSYAAWWDEIKKQPMIVRNCIVWDKGDGGLGSNYTMRHEFVIYTERLTKAITMSAANKGRNARMVNGRANVQRFNVPQNDDRLHNAAKPLDLLNVFIDASSDAGDIVLDPFLGSGTTLIACEKLGRRCRAVEIDPGYTAVALQRFFDMTGVEPVLLEAS